MPISRSMSLICNYFLLMTQMLFGCLQWCCPCFGSKELNESRAVVVDPRKPVDIVRE